MNQQCKPTIEELFADNELIDRALKEAVRRALKEHKRAGNPVAVCQNGNVVWIPPEEIPDGDQSETDKNSDKIDNVGS